MNRNETIRLRLLAIRAEFRRKLDDDTARGLHNRAVFYSGVDAAAVRRFCTWVGQQDAACLGATNLESLSAGRYLHERRDELVQLFGSGDFDHRAAFDLGDGSSFSGSIMGLWRELSARYARACSGQVHVLLAPDRARLHRASLAYWSRGRRTAGLPRELKVFGFVELPILMGLLADNRGVSAVRLYSTGAVQPFELLADGALQP